MGSSPSAHQRSKSRPVGVLAPLPTTLLAVSLALAAPREPGCWLSVLLLGRSLCCAAVRGQ